MYLTDANLSYHQFSGPENPEKGVRIILNCTLYIDVALVLDGEVRIVWHNVTIVNLRPTHNILPPIIRAMVDGVTLFIHCGSILK